jgi:hypothetical protein
LREQPFRQAGGQLSGESFESVDQGAGHAAQEKFHFHVTAGQRIGGQGQLFKHEPGTGGERFDLLGVEQEDVAICVRLELNRLIGRRVGRIGKLWEFVTKISAFGVVITT